MRHLLAHLLAEEDVERLGRNAGEHLGDAPFVIAAPAVHRQTVDEYEVPLH